MRADYYITIEGSLTREQNTVYFKNEQGKRIIPIEKINAIYSFKSLSLSAGIVGILCKYGIPVHFFGWYGNYEGTLWPKESLISGDLLVKQAEHYSDQRKRVDIAKRIVAGSIKNMEKNISNYEGEIPDLIKYRAAFEKELDNLEKYETIQQLMSAEGHVRCAYYEIIDSLLPEDFRISERKKQPPSNKGNCLLSFGNSLVYATVLSEIYRTHLHPAISFLHEPFERRFSLSLDIAEIFKPILADRIILGLVRRKMLDDSHFDSDVGNVLLSDSGRKLFLQQYDERLNSTIKHKGLGRSISYRQLIRLELYKLEKHILGTKEYRPFVMWW